MIHSLKQHSSFLWKCPEHSMAVLGMQDISLIFSVNQTTPIGGENNVTYPNILKHQVYRINVASPPMVIISSKLPKWIKINLRLVSHLSSHLWLMCPFIAKKKPLLPISSPRIKKIKEQSVAQILSLGVLPKMFSAFRGMQSNLDPLIPSLCSTKNHQKIEFLASRRKE